MIREALEFLKDSFQGQQTTEVLTQVCETNKRYFWFAAPGKEPQRLERKPDPLRVTANDIPSFAAIINTFGMSATVWVSPDCVTAVLNDEGIDEFRDHRATLSVAQSSVFRALNGAQLNQRDMLKYLRLTLSACEIDPKNTVDLIRALKFSYSDNETGTVKPQSDSLGREVHAEVTGADKLPLMVKLSFPPYPSLPDDLGTVSVECLFNVDPAGKTLALVPIDGQVDAARNKALALLRDRVAKELESVGNESKVFCGTP